MSQDKKEQDLDTILLHAGHTPDAETGSRAVPIYQTTSYVFKDTEHAANLFGLKEFGNIYTRLMNPTTDVLEKRVAALEGGAAALALSSGTSAIFYSIINICRQGDEIVSANNLYGGTFSQFDSILPQLGITTRMVDPSDPANFEAAINEKTRAIYCETIGNPTLNMIDLEAVAKVAEKHHLPLVVDSTFTPPCLLKPPFTYGHMRDAMYDKVPRFEKRLGCVIRCSAAGVKLLNLVPWEAT